MTRNVSMGHGCPRYCQICINRALPLTRGHNSDDNWWILSVIELDLYFMITYLCMKYESKYTNVLKRYRPETIFHTEIKGHNSDNDWWFLFVIKLDLFFIIIYLCMKYESISPMYSKDIARKPFFVPRPRALTLMIIG